MTDRELIANGEAVLGIEFGSTRIKLELINDEYASLASGVYDWENKYENGLWTYDLEDVWTGLQVGFKDLKKNVKEKYDTDLNNLKAIGVSAMMHGYLAFDKDGKQLVPFRTWRNNNAGEAAQKLSKIFKHNIPFRWSSAHLYQAILNKEEHIDKIDYITTLAGYVHWKLTGEKVLGIGDASGMLPIDNATKDYETASIEKFDELIEENGLHWKVEDILPKILLAGQTAGHLTREGAKLIDPSGELEAGIPLCPPEGDAGTGMTSTNTTDTGLANVSAGTSAFIMVVLQDTVKGVNPYIDPVTTPDGKPVAMIHTNNCTTEIDAWVDIFKEYTELIGADVSDDEIYESLFKNALNGDVEGMVNYGYHSGENITEVEEGRPMFLTRPDAKFNLASLIKSLLYSAFATMVIGLNNLKEQDIELSKIVGHGGIFTTRGVAQQILADLMEAPVSVMDTASRGGAWGVALLAAYMMDDYDDLDEFLNKKVFSTQKEFIVKPSEDTSEASKYIKQFVDVLELEQKAHELL